MSDRDYIKEAQKDINRGFLEEIQSAEKKGTIEIPRGLSDEEVLKMYHDPEINAEITREIINAYFRREIELFYEKLGIPCPVNLDLVEFVE